VLVELVYWGQTTPAKFLIRPIVLEFLVESKTRLVVMPLFRKAAHNSRDL
jgi:hypothetical protein